MSVAARHRVQSAHAVLGSEPVALDFDDVFRKCAPFALRALRGLGVHDRDVEDVCQEVFIIVHRRKARFDGSSSVKTWVYGICVRKAAEYRRSNSRRKEHSTAKPPEELVAAPQIDSVHLEEVKLRLQRALDHLDADKRAVFVLYEFEELTLAEIAEATETSINTVYSRLIAARKRVIAAIGKETA